MATIDKLRFLDSRNEGVWEVVSKAYEISIEYSSDETFGCYTINKTAIIYVPFNDFCKASFTHELLHVFLKSKDIYIGNFIKRSIEENVLLSETLSPDLIEHIGNCLDHHKMLPIYLQLGFEKEKFITDFHKEKCSEADLNVIEQLLKLSGSLWNISVDQFLGRFFSIKACPNDMIDYTNYLSRLERIDTDLFKIIDSFWLQWQVFDIDNLDPVFNTYYGFTGDFIDQLFAWIKYNKKAA